ncbi:hypothetical protein [Aliiroseovarius crassostreae]|uniref:hypothetical protein n=1 Tax=Aliiroseovarius crassostreae TaxID=154981 RepID=UPI00128F19D6|nr:hypothetical protein [Aliiroseovarius crassostreae]
MESELERVIASLVKRPDGLFTTSPRLSFGHKVNLLRAVWEREPEQADKICSVLQRLNDLRNAVADADPKNISGCYTALTEAYREIDSSTGDEVDVLTVAQSICLFLGDGSIMTDFMAMTEALDNLVNVKMPKILGGAK